MHVVSTEALTFEGIAFITSLAKTVAVEGIRVDDDRATRIKVRQIRLERRGIHRDQNLRRVARCIELGRRKIDLIAA